jgi:hypothetical protein
VGLTDYFRRIIAVAILAVLAFGAAAGQRPGERKKLSADEILSQKATDCYTHVSYEDENLSEYFDDCVNIRKVPVQGLVADFLEWRPMPFGFAPAAFDGPPARLDFTPVSMSVRDLLDSIVAADSRYQWSLKDGVVNLLPAANHPPVLDVRLGEFKGKGSVGDLFFALKKRPEVQQRAAELGFDTEGRSDDANGFIGSIWVSKVHTYDIHCRDCTVLESLNEIARQSGGSWMYRENTFGGKKDFYFTFIYLTE